MNFEKALILQLVVLAVVLESDLGERRIGFFRIIRPVVAAVAVGVIYLKSLPSGSHDTVLMAVGAGLGVVLGLLSVSPAFVSVRFDRAFRSRGLLGGAGSGEARPAAVSRAGAGYAAIWILAAAARLAFSYGSVHWFPHGLAVFLHKHQLSADALTDALIFYALGMDLFRSAGLLMRAGAARLAVRDGLTGTA